MVRDVVQNNGIVIGYSNDLGMEVNINCTLPNGDKLVTSAFAHHERRLFEHCCCCQVEMVHSTEVTPPFMTGWLINKFFQGREQIKWKMAALFESGILTALESKGTAS